jgi:hypothetical protein
MRIRKMPGSAEFYAQLALEQKENLLFYDAMLNINEAIRIEPENELYYSLKADILSLNDDEIQSNELYFFIQRFFDTDKSISIAGNFIRFGRDELIQHYFRRGIEKVIESGQDTQENKGFLQQIIKDMDKAQDEAGEEQELPSYDKFEEIVDLERENFINVKDKREAAYFGKMLTLLDKQDYMGAIKASEMIPPGSKYYLDTLELRMNAMFFIKDIKGALACADKLSNLSPCNVSMFNVYASIYDEINNKDMAKIIKQKATEALEILLSEAEYEEIFTIAEIFFANGAFEPCAKLLEKYVEENRIREEGLLMLAVTLFALNRKKEAMRHLKRASDLFGLWSCAPTVMELLLSDCEIKDYQNILTKLPGNFASQKVTVLTEKIQAAQKGYYSIEEEEFYEQVLSLAKLSEPQILKPLFDLLARNILDPVFKKALDLVLISDMVYWEDAKTSLIKSILDNAPEEVEYFEGAIVVDGLYNGLYLPFRLKIENREDREKFTEYYKQAVMHILRQDYAVDGGLIAQIAQDVYKSALKGGFSPKSESCLVQIICIIYKMTLDGDSFEEAKYFTENGQNCQLKTLRKYRDILDVEGIVRRFSANKDRGKA